MQRATSGGQCASGQIIPLRPSLRCHSALLNLALSHLRQCVVAGLATPKQAEEALIWASRVNTGKLRAYLDSMDAGRAKDNDC